MVSLLAAFIVSYFHRQRKNFQSLLSWLIIILRYSLAFSMLVFGFAKVFYLQFRYPDLAKLEQPIGQVSPMGLLWLFMGYSKTYCIFTGVLDVIAGLLFISKQPPPKEVALKNPLKEGILS